MPSRRLHARIQHHPTMVVWALVVLMSACVLGLVAWKAALGREMALTRNEDDVRNLVHSLTQHAVHSFQAPDVAMGGLVDLLKYRKPESAARFNAYLANTVRSLPQLREIKVLDVNGDAIYSSGELQTHNNADRAYFHFHRDTPGNELRISGPFKSRTTGLPTIVLSKRISDAATGAFAGIVMATIPCDYFAGFYQSFRIGEHGAISLITGDGKVLARWPEGSSGRDLSGTPLFQTRLKQDPVGYYRITSPFDGIAKYFGYEQADRYPIVVTVARSEAQILAGWQQALRRDALVAFVLLLVVAGIATLLARQFHYRTRLEQSLCEREARYRLLAENIADIVLVLDARGVCRYVSQSIHAALGMTEDMVVGRSCLDFVHPDDHEIVANSGSLLDESSHSRSITFRVRRPDGSIVWLESNFRPARGLGPEGRSTVAVLRDVTQRKLLEDELSTATRRLAQLATTDGLTRLANRRSFDGFLREAYEHNSVLSVLMIDIDHFKGFNDTLGHQAGDDCLRQIAGAIDQIAARSGGQAARYGGEEFAVVLPGLTEERAMEIAEQLRQSVINLDIRHPAAPRGPVTISIGVADKQEIGSNDIALLRQADIALYRAKDAGRNRAVASTSLHSAEVASPPLADLDLAG
ncbi:diguanylate cyclase [Bradyrhizobium arachidis]|uniref:sensor domain-containing diguanylate cyclase n=1 Tax=Bradyrhizobium TaxID=374 RepID=UPI0021620290|nr:MULTISPECIES: diguanylate cyclase [Bradyrhizobium]MDN4982926.1 diguanylate cyclase [Bradyrhizobium sp. WYCCWR 13022]UVO34401.1 diguanylate cyclase [Bradyrhizobium arachidis]